MSGTTKFIAVFFYENGEHETFKQGVGLGIPVKELNSNKVSYVYIATSESDAKAAIAYQKDKQGALKDDQ